MRFSSRTNWNTEENDLSLAYRRRKAAGLPLADLTASNPTRCGFDYPEDLLAVLSTPAAFDYDPQPRGALRAREAVCDYYRSHGVALDPAQLVLTTSTSEAYSYLFRLLCDPGAELIVPQPGYPLFDYLAELEDVHITPVGLVYDEGWQLDPEALRRAVTPATRAIMLVHPNNPTGHYTRPWEVEELGKICREHDLALIVDEVFLDYAFDRPEKSFAAGIDGVPVFVVSGLSKICGLPQMKAAWIAATGPEKEAALDRLEVIADTFLSMNAPVQSALPVWLAERAGIQRQITARTRANLATLDQKLKKIPAASRLISAGGWYAVVRIPALAPDDETVRLLLDQGVWVHPGYFFGLPESGWLVLSLLAPEAEFGTGVTILVNTLETNQAGNNF